MSQMTMRVEWKLDSSPESTALKHTHAKSYTHLHRFSEASEARSWITKCPYILHSKILLKMINFNPTISIITLNMNSVSITVKIQGFPHWIKKKDSIIGHLKEIHFKNQDSEQLIWKGWKKLHYIYGKGLIWQACFVQILHIPKKGLFSWLAFGWSLGTELLEFSLCKGYFWGYKALGCAELVCSDSSC